MARSLSLIFLALAAAAVAVAAISAQAKTTNTIHIPYASAPFSPLRFINRHQPRLGPYLHHRRHHHHHRHHAPAPSPSSQEVALPPEPFPGFYICLEKLAGTCGSEIYRGIFGEESVSARCCGQLVGIGRRCHREIMKATLELPEMAKVEKEKIKKRDAEIWSQCVFINNLKAGGSSRFPISP
ncbi:hypothetical protein ABFS82_06G053700 [Erythranthe guttata]|nr:PREDICTED: uncharacterized protein LOC105977386 [Erythranthe guttata]|eukprot:XP_012858140.1 PREDICTED: uncharacterized protein LOC105977386 [Erythranthe guttata]